MSGNLTLKVTITADGRSLVQTMEGAGKSVGEFGGKAESAFGKLKASLSSTQAQLGALAGALGFGSMVRGIVQTNTEIAGMRAAMETVTGSVEAADAAFRELTDFAATTPFDMTQSIEGFTRLKSLGLDPTIERLTSFGNTASAMNKSLMQMIEAVADASTGEFERLKEFGIRASQTQDSVAFTFQGITTTVGKNAEEITAYLESIGNETFGDAMANQMNTLVGLFSNLGDAAHQLQQAVGEGGLNDSLKELLKALNLLAGEGGESARSLGKVLGGLLDAATWAVGGFQSLVEILGPNGSTMAGAFLGIAGAIAGILTPALVALAVVGGPITLVVGGVALLGATWLTFGDKIKDFISGAWQELVGAMTAAGEWLKDVGDAAAAMNEAVIGSIEAMVTGVQDWLGNKLKAIMGPVAGFFGLVAEAAGDMEDDVTGHSYVPDMVNAIEHHFGRLGDVMVAPAEAATSAIASAFDQVGRDVAGHIGAMVRQGEITLGGFADFVDGMMQRIMDSMIQMAVVDPLANAFAGRMAGLFTPAATAAHGLAFAGGEIQPFAKGGIVNRPTLFPFAKGIGLMGEAGPEAILPLTRLPGGDLGVRADIGRQSQGGVTVNVYDQRTQAAEPVEVKERVGADGHRIVEVMIRDQVNRMIVQGQTDRAMIQRYGMRPRGV